MLSPVSAKRIVILDGEGPTEHKMFLSCFTVGLTRLKKSSCLVTGCELSSRKLGGCTQCVCPELCMNASHVLKVHEFVAYGRRSFFLKAEYFLTVHVSTTFSPSAHLSTGVQGVGATWLLGTMLLGTWQCTPVFQLPSPVLPGKPSEGRLLKGHWKTTQEGTNSV